MRTNPALEEAISAAGGPGALAAKLNEKPQTVGNWRARGVVPANRCPAVERITGVERCRLRPGDWHEYWPERAQLAAQSGVQPNG